MSWTTMTAVVSPAPEHLGSGTIAGWRAYVAAVEQRRRNDAAGPHFLVMDAQPDAAEERRSLAAGAVVVRAMPVETFRGAPIEVSSALVHHWRGAVLVPRVTVPDLMTALEHADPPAIQDDVLSSAVLWRRPGATHVYLRLRRERIVTVVYNTEHDVTFLGLGPTRATSTTTSTKIAEVQAPGTPDERELAPGDDRGFLWRLNAYWRYQAVPGGVVAECESVSLSRAVPFGLKTIASPLITSAAKDSMERTLDALRRRFGRAR